jgi:hypothetical protein
LRITSGTSKRCHLRPKFKGGFGTELQLEGGIGLPLEAITTLEGVVRLTSNPAFSGTARSMLMAAVLVSLSFTENALSGTSHLKNGETTTPCSNQGYDR